MNRMRTRFQYSAMRAALGSLLAVAWIVATAASANAQVPLFDGLDWVMDRGANQFANVSGMINAMPGMGPTGVPLRQGANAFNARINDGAGNPDGASLLNNDPWHA